MHGATLTHPQTRDERVITLTCTCGETFKGLNRDALLAEWARHGATK